MLQRNDLAKQFSLVVQQEIKNFNDEKYAILQALALVNVDISSLNKSLLENYAKLQSEQVFLLGEIAKTLEESRKGYLILQRNLGDQSKKHLQELNLLTSEQKLFKEDLRELSLLPEKIQGIFEHVSFFTDQIQEYQKGYAESLVGMHGRFKKDIQRCKEEILETPSDAEVIEKKLTEKLDAHIVDVEAVTKELKTLQKEAVITEKKLENIYMLIGRSAKKG